MLALILLIIFGLGVAYFATGNTGVVHILLGNYLIKGIPLYIIVVGSILLGVFISWIISVVNNISSFLTIYGKDAEIKKAQNAIDELKRENKNLKEEIFSLKEDIDHEKEVEVEEVMHPRISSHQTFSHSLG